MKRIVLILSLAISLFAQAKNNEFVEIISQEEQPLPETPKVVAVEVGAAEVKGVDVDQGDDYLLKSTIAANNQRAANLSSKVIYFTLKQGLLKSNIESLTMEFLPSHSIVWQADQRLEQYADLTLSGNGYEDVLGQIVKQFGIGACIRANNVIEIYDILNNRFYCEE
ncbi:hypothetical protein OCF84_20815 (plasmid) [Shewanella xiamenensis]|uniref:Uncharacterized protein n=1 Tax=Shewanella xiamenensis TaxID=332186 RepID=A0ABT6UFP5_9GAMM|nr:hypothetical protein [Shewanella xiamenensis]MDI5833289.1 hypothetical protein [Shewanella xiamenensis]WHF57961.1 hypothetical protein OCF84_20815 [Shewanella xiamenensis]